MLVRDVFELGEPVLVGSVATNKPTKWERVNISLSFHSAPIEFLLVLKLHGPSSSILDIFI